MQQQNLKINGERVAYEEINGEVIIIDLLTGNYFSLYGSAGDIWRLLDDNPTVVEIVDALAQRYPADHAVLEEAVQRFINDLLAEEIIMHGVEPAAVRPLPSLSPALSPFSTPAFDKYTNMSDLLLLDSIHDVDGSGWPTEKKSN